MRHLFAAMLLVSRVIGASEYTDEWGKTTIEFPTRHDAFEILLMSCVLKRPAIGVLTV
jgi:hypothetical protein